MFFCYFSYEFDTFLKILLNLGKNSTQPAATGPFGALGAKSVISLILSENEEIHHISPNFIKIS